MYVTFSQLENIIETNSIKVSCPWRTNDVTEGVFRGEREQREELKEYGYVCFSASPYSPAMWGYYADRSRGACLMFEFLLGRKDNKGTFLLIDDDWTVSSSSCCVMLRSVSYKRDRERKGNSVLSALFSKSKNWEHEKEYRLLVKLSKIYADTSEKFIPPEGFYLSSLTKYIKGVILGSKCDFQVEEFRQHFHSFAKNLFLTRAQISEKSYDMSIDFSGCPTLSLPTEKKQNYTISEWLDKATNTLPSACSSVPPYRVEKEGDLYFLKDGKEPGESRIFFNVSQKELAQIHERNNRLKAPSKHP